MKKLFALILVAVMCFSLVACGESANTDTELSSLATADDTEENQILSGAAVAINLLRSELKNPHSLEVYSVYFKAHLGSYYYKINYSAENDLGGRIEGYKYVRTSTAKFDYDLKQGLKQGEQTVQSDYESANGEAIKVDSDKALELSIVVFDWL